MRLFTPGPVMVREEVLKAMSHEMISHRGQEISSWQREICQYMQAIWQTKNTVLCSSSSGTGLMEGALSSCVMGKVAVFSVGAFGKRFYDIALSLGLEADHEYVNWGEPIAVDIVKAAAKSGVYEAIVLTHNETSTGVMNPLGELAETMKAQPEILWVVDSVSGTGGASLPVDEWGIDIAITSSQKCLGLPPGMAFCTFSDKARAMAEKKAHRGYYFDLLKLEEYAKKKDQYPSTPNVSLMAAALMQLRYIVEEEGVEDRLKRHRRLQGMVHEWVDQYGGYLAKEGYRSPTVTAVTLPEGKDVSRLINRMKEKGYLLSNGYGKEKGKSFRIAHMADCTEENMAGMLKMLTAVYQSR